MRGRLDPPREAPGQREAPHAQATTCRAAVGQLPAANLRAPVPRERGAKRGGSMATAGRRPTIVFFALLGGLVVRVALRRVAIAAHSAAATQ
eukprot:6336440-Pyramimonas_sp.AAC.1